jgi:hypothetical protein
VEPWSFPFVVAAEVGEGVVVLWDNLAPLMIRLPEAEGKKLAKWAALASTIWKQSVTHANIRKQSVTHANIWKQIKQQSRRENSATVEWMEFMKRCAHLERRRENGATGKWIGFKKRCADLDTVHVQENRFADVELPKARELI